MDIKFIYNFGDYIMDDVTEMHEFDEEDLLKCTKFELVDYIVFLRRDVEDLEEETSEYFEAISSFVSDINKKGLGDMR